MSLPNLEEILNKNKEEEIFLALKIEINEVKSAVWSLKDGQIETLATGEKAEWGEGKEELMVACDSSIATAVTKLELEKKVIPHKLVLGLPSHWVKDNKILPDKSADILFITKKLSLSALGFVVVPEAIAYFLKNEEKDFSSAILIFLGLKEITVSLIDKGKVLQSEVVGRSDNLALDVEEGVLRFSLKNLPPRILLYNSEDLEGARQTLISYPWQPPSDAEKKPGFLHLPRVEILPTDFDIQAVVFAGGEELKKSREVKEVEEMAPEKEEIVVPQEAPLLEETVTDQTEPDLTGPEAGIEFVKGEDILEKIKNEPEKEIESEATKESLETIPEVSYKPAKKIALSTKIFNFLAFFKRVPQKIISRLKLKKEASPEISFSRRPLILPRLVLPVLLLIILTFGSFYFLTKAEVVLTMAPETIEKEISFKISETAGKINLEEKIIPVKTVSTQTSGSKMMSATGKKTVGEKAKGELTIYNRTDALKKFAVGATLIGPGKLKFYLDTEVKVASKTADLASGIDRWGEAKAGVTAEEIGTQYNIDAASQFSFEDLSSTNFLAKNQVAFLGGTSRQIIVVSKEDQEKLLAALLGELKQKGAEELKGKLSGDEGLIPDSATAEIKVKKFDREVMDESTTVGLNLVAENKIMIFKKSDLTELALNLLGSDQVLLEAVQKEKTEFTLTRQEPDGQNFQSKIKFFLKPAINTDEVITKVIGRPFSIAQTSLLALKSVLSVKINISPRIFKIFPLMPLKKSNISVTFRI